MLGVREEVVRSRQSRLTSNIEHRTSNIEHRMEYKKEGKSLGALPCHAIAVGDGGSPSLSGIVTSKRDDDGLGYEIISK